MIIALRMNLLRKCIKMIFGFECELLYVRWPVGGTPDLSQPFRLVLHLHCFSAFPSHFLSSLCSVTLSLLTLPLSTPPSNALSHHCFSSLLPPRSLLLLKFFPLFQPEFHLWWTPIFSLPPPSSPSFYLPRAHSCCQSDTFGLGCLMYTEPTSSFTSIIMKCGEQQRINASTFLLLQLFIIHCIFMLQWETISMAIHAGALSGENIIILTEIGWQRTFLLVSTSV